MTNFKKLIKEIKDSDKGWTDVTIASELKTGVMTIWRLAVGKKHGGTDDPKYSTGEKIIALHKKVTKK